MIHFLDSVNFSKIWAVGKLQPFFRASVGKCLEELWDCVEWVSTERWQEILIFCLIEQQEMSHATISTFPFHESWYFSVIVKYLLWLEMLYQRQRETLTFVIDLLNGSQYVAASGVYHMQRLMLLGSCLWFLHWNRQLKDSGWTEELDATVILTAVICDEKYLASLNIQQMLLCKGNRIRQVDSVKAKAVCHWRFQQFNYSLMCSWDYLMI